MYLSKAIWFTVFAGYYTDMHPHENWNNNYPGLQHDTYSHVDNSSPTVDDLAREDVRELANKMNINYTDAWALMEE